MKWCWKDIVFSVSLWKPTQRLQWLGVFPDCKLGLVVQFLTKPIVKGLRMVLTYRFMGHQPNLSVKSLQHP